MDLNKNNQLKVLETKNILIINQTDIVEQTKKN